MSGEASSRGLAVVVVAATAMLLVGTAGHALHNGDEAIYAQMAREMRASGDWGTLRWQGEAQFPRPPLSVWLLAATGEVRVTLAALSGLELALVLALGYLWWGPLGGVAAAGALLGSDLFLGYGRYFESEPLLCVMVLGLAVCWQRRQYLGWGVFLGLSLMTKQAVGGLPLLVLLLRAAQTGVARPGGGGPGLGAVAYLCCIAAWDGVSRRLLLVRNLVARSTAPMLHVTRWNFYFRELWRSEGPLALLSNT